MKNFIALVPAYKPDSLMLGMLSELASEGFSTVVINDGSGEDFVSRFEEAKQYATVLEHPHNMGKGQAIRTGLSYIYETFSGDYQVVTVDADGQHKVSDAKELCLLVGTLPDTLYLGSRRLVGDVPARSSFGNNLTRKVFRLATGVAVHDTQTGLRAFNSSLIPRLLRIKGNRYEYEMNMLMELASSGTSIKEMEIETIYINDNEGSHFNPFKDSVRIYKEIIKFVLFRKAKCRREYRKKAKKRKA